MKMSSEKEVHQPSFVNVIQDSCRVLLRGQQQVSGKMQVAEVKAEKVKLTFFPNGSQVATSHSCSNIATSPLIVPTATCVELMAVVEGS
jgi:hypothetical protein